MERDCQKAGSVAPMEIAKKASCVDASGLEASLEALREGESLVSDARKIKELGQQRMAH